jgi:hypothetical protein
MAAPYVLGVESASLAELQKLPEAWAIVIKHAPVYNLLVSMAAVKPYVTNMTVDSFVQYGTVKAEVVAMIDADLKQLPAPKWEGK